MKKLTSYNRAAGYLNKLFDLLNSYYFDNELPRPTLTIQSTPSAYGHFSTVPLWFSSTGCTHEINIGAGTLGAPIEQLVGVLLHEMVHYFCSIHNIKDCSRNNTYHNRKFKEAAENHGLIAKKDPKYGWTLTEPNDDTITFILENELTDIQLCRLELSGLSVSGSGDTHAGTNVNTIPPTKPSSSRKYICKICGSSVRATKSVNIACLDCQTKMELA